MWSGVEKKEQALESGKKWQPRRKGGAGKRLCQLCYAGMHGGNSKKLSQEELRR